MADDETLFQKGMPIRREVLCPEYVDASMAQADEFMMSFPAGDDGMGMGLGVGRCDARPKARSGRSRPGSTPAASPHFHPSR